MVYRGRLKQIKCALDGDIKLCFCFLSTPIEGSKELECKAERLAKEIEEVGIITFSLYWAKEMAPGSPGCASIQAKVMITCSLKGKPLGLTVC